MSLPNDFLRPRSSRLPITLENAELDAALRFGGLGNAPLLPNWEGCCCRGPAKPTATTNSYTKSLSQAKAKIYAGLKPYSARLPTLTRRSTLCWTWYFIKFMMVHDQLSIYVTDMHSTHDDHMHCESMLRWHGTDKLHDTYNTVCSLQFKSAFEILFCLAAKLTLINIWNSGNLQQEVVLLWPRQISLPLMRLPNHIYNPTITKLWWLKVLTWYNRFQAYKV